MRATVGRMAWLGVLVAVLWAAPSARAESPSVVGYLFGIELAAQTDAHGAIFLFDFVGRVDGRFRAGWGYVEVWHETPLPGPGESVFILDATGVLCVRRQQLEISAGVGALGWAEEDLFDVMISFDLSKPGGNSVPHAFGGRLSHQTFPPVIWGRIGPDDTAG